MLLLLCFFVFHNDWLTLAYIYIDHSVSPGICVCACVPFLEATATEVLVLQYRIIQRMNDHSHHQIQLNRDTTTWWANVFDPQWKFRRRSILNNPLNWEDYTNNNKTKTNSSEPRELISNERKIGRKQKKKSKLMVDGAAQPIEIYLPWQWINVIK